MKNQLKPTEKPLLRNQEIIFIIIEGLLKNFKGGMKGIDADASNCGLPEINGIWWFGVIKLKKRRSEYSVIHPKTEGV